MKKLLKIVFILMFIFILGVHKTEAESKSAVIDTDVLNIRSGPGLSYGVTSSLKKGDKVDIVSTSGDWLEITFEDKTGWIASWFTIRSHGEEIHQKVVSNVNNLNIRSSPSIESAILGQLNTGETAIKTDQDGEWARVTVGDIDGWIHTDYFSTINNNNMDKPDSSMNNSNFFTVAVDALNVRKKGDLTSKRIDLIYKDETYKVKEVDGNWVKIELNKRKVGWVYSFHGVLSNEKSGATVQSTPKKVYINTDGTNIRQEATTSSTIVIRANAGEQFEVVSEANDWYELRLSSGETAYVASWVVSVMENQVQKNGPKKKRVPGTLHGLTIVIDPGHGGKDFGTTGANGTPEKTVTLLTSELLAKKLKAAGADVILTRQMDTYISLNKRVASSHQNEADAFISIHYDSTTNPSISGFTTYYTHERQRALANAVNNGLDATLSLRNRGAQPGNYLVLRENRQNAILLELGFLSNPFEEQTINTLSFREQATLGIYNGLLNYFDNQLN